MKQEHFEEAKKLQASTGVGLSACKRALIVTNHDWKLAQELLKKEFPGAKPESKQEQNK